MKLNEALTAARARLVAARIAPDEAAVDVDVYACTILGWDRAQLLAARQEPVPRALEPRFSDWLARREQREPTAYIIGTREFWGLDFAVSPAVLIPRPESELIVEEAIGILRALPRARLADIGTGSGNLAVSIAHACAAIEVVATDISGDALAVAVENARRHGVLGRVTFHETSYLDGVAGPFDVIVANPPYVKDEDRLGLSRQVEAFEPHVALVGGADGLRDVTGVLDTAVGSLDAGGCLIFEFGLGQDDRIVELVAARPELRLHGFREDLQGIARTAVVKRL